METETLKMKIDRKLIYNFTHNLVKLNINGKELFESLSNIRGTYIIEIFSYKTGSRRSYKINATIHEGNKISIGFILSKHFSQLYFEFESKNEYLKWKLKA